MVLRTERISLLLSLKPCNYKRDCAYANGFSLSAEGLDVVSRVTVKSENMSYKRGRSFVTLFPGLEARVARSRNLIAFANLEWEARRA